MTGSTIISCAVMPKTTKPLLTTREIAAVRAPIERALTLPARAFTSEAFFAWEIERVFRRQWTALAFAHTVPKPGDARPIELFGMPLLIVRGDDRRVRVFHNICPYDGCLALLDARAGLREIEVYYHGWRYDLRGKLIAAPFWSGRPENGRRDLGKWNGDLVEVRAETRLDVVFVDLEGMAGSIDTHLKPLRDELAEYDLDGAVPVEDDDGPTARVGRELATNWKTYLENAGINVLHESFTHEGYRRSPEVPRVRDGKKTYFDVARGGLMALGYRLADFTRTYGTGGSLPHLGRKSSRPPDRGYFLTYYPNLVLPVRHSMYRINICLPEAPDRTRILHCGYFHRDAPATPGFADDHRALVERYREVYREDGRAIDAVQRARRSPAWSQHFYAPFWDIQYHHFNRLILEDLVGRARGTASSRPRGRRRG